MDEDKRLYASNTNRTLLILDDIYESFDRYPESKSALYSLMSKILMMPQKTLAITLFCRKNEKYLLVYHTVKDSWIEQDFLEKNPPPGVSGKINHKILEESGFRIFGTDYWLCFHLIEYNYESGGWDFHLVMNESTNPKVRPAYESIKELFALYEKSEAAEQAYYGEGTDDREFRAEIQMSDFLSFAALSSLTVNTDSLDPAVLKSAEIYVEEIQKMFERLYRDICSSPLLKKTPSNASFLTHTNFPNIFFLLRTKTNTAPRWGIYDYDLRFLMPREQLRDIAIKITPSKKSVSRKNVGTHCDFFNPESETCRWSDTNSRRCAPHGMTEEELLHVLREKFGMNSRSFSDFSLSNGIISFSNQITASGKGKLRPGASNEEKKFFDLTACIFKKVYDHSTPSAFIIPIVVCGAPWISCFTVTNDSMDKKVFPCSWKHNYHFYRGLIKESMTRNVRIMSRQMYLDKISKIIANILLPAFYAAIQEQLSTAFKTANQEAWSLSLVYPYDVIQFIQDKPDSVGHYIVDWYCGKYSDFGGSHKEYIMDNKRQYALHLPEFSLLKLPNFNFSKVLDAEFLSMEAVEEAANTGLELFDNADLRRASAAASLDPTEEQWIERLMELAKK